MSDVDKPLSIQVRDLAYYTPTRLGQTRSITPEGFLLIRDTPIARIGEQTYSGTELPLETNKDGQIIVQRLPDDVFRPDTVASFEGKPITVEHPNEFVTPETWKDKSVGHVQNVRRGAGIEDDLLIGDFLIQDPEAIAYVNRELPEVSAGYNAEYRMLEPGRAIQHSIIGNHVALVTSGRAGPRVAIKDHQPLESKIMSQKPSAVARIGRAITAMFTTDAEAEKAEKEMKGETADGPGGSETMCDALIKRINDALDARDAKHRDEEEKRTKDATEEEETRRAKDAAEKEEKEKREAEDRRHRDAVLSAEAISHVVNLGKTYAAASPTEGYGTGDSAPPPVLKDVFAKAEILSPGIGVPTKDSLKQDDTVSKLIRATLDKAYTTDAGRECIDPFLTGRQLSVLTGDAMFGVFNGAAELMRQRNNRAGRLQGVIGTRDFGKQVDASEINRRNREYWAKQGAK